MVENLITTLLLGLATFAVVQIIAQKFGPLPRYVLPVAVLVVVASHAIWGQYSWYPREKDRLPDNLVVVETFENPSAFAPWSYLARRVTRFAAIDPSAIKNVEGQEGYKTVRAHLRGRLEEPFFADVLVDCEGRRLALVTTDDGGSKLGPWQKATKDGLADKVCKPS
jgi:hypothetical protein|tara:strand:+ start:7854 stop:8354 length:501 start_codon:yes stop_codon:yes gene_type:complete